MQNLYLFQLGSMHSLCWSELLTFFPKAQRLNQSAALVSTNSPLELKPLLASMGGIIKIAQVWQSLPQADNDQLQEEIINYLQNLASEKIYFALGELGRDHLEPLDVIAIKKQLKAAGKKVRFADAKRWGASAALLLNRAQLQEIIIAQGEKQVVLATTKAVQDIDEWARRDRSKPYANHKKGMLPPKLARQMLNLAQLPHDASIYDPFCGTGTILLEALLDPRCAHIHGSDLDPQAVAGSQANIAWLKDTSQLLLARAEASVNIFASNATTTNRAQLQNQLLDAIISEPFLGKQTPSEKDLPNIFRGLEKLYYGCFKNWRSLLKSQATVVIVFPRAQSRHLTFSLDGLLDKLQAIGYTKRSENLEYARPGALIKREICVFDFKG